MNEPSNVSVRQDVVTIDPRPTPWALARRLIRRDHAAPRSYAAGKTWLRDRVVQELDCSEVEAERMVDRLESQGVLRFARDGRGDPRRGEWSVTPVGQLP